ncbi:unnamed protein product [Rotaria magnacalcarata]|uniref:Uncharacterized protein n=1 Tax=Rotaria magnacalcarata TaxID=392030 RepID=A0A820J2A3_9BILA|nr:unnamed protein product [Rotaria magnacalcarata]CAF5197669.1 unnamed protein product [Rotaria magnacalcarata]CAF5221765.1 unnamed protein product [Rotaria magnacalcarata]
MSLFIYFNARKEQIFDDFNDTPTITRSISSISSTTSNVYIEIHQNGNFLSFLVSSYINECMKTSLPYS